MKKIIRLISSPVLMAVIMALFFFSITSATFIEKIFGTAAAWNWIYQAVWFNLLLLIAGINLLINIIVKKIYQQGKFTLFLFHVAFLVILTGAAITRFTGYVGTMSIREGKTGNTFRLQSEAPDTEDEGIWVKLPFTLHLTDFRIERYPGSGSPSGFESKVILVDSVNGVREQRSIYMNNVLKYKGFRFYQFSYDADEKGTVLLVSHDPAGNFVTYTGYLLMIAGMFLSLFNRNSRFRKLAGQAGKKNPSRALALVLLSAVFSGSAYTQETGPMISSIPDISHASAFGSLLVQNPEGRIEPVNTLSSHVLRKLYGKDKFHGLNPDQVFLGMISDPGRWQYVPIIRETHPEVQEILGSRMKYYSFAAFFRGENYILRQDVENAYRKRPSNRSKKENEIIRLDERINIAYLVMTGGILNIFPRPGDSAYRWDTPRSGKDYPVTGESEWIQRLYQQYLIECRKSLFSGNWQAPDTLLRSVRDFQHRYGASVIPGKQRIQMEILLNRANIFDKISVYYGITGIVFLVYQFLSLFKEKIRHRIPSVIALVCILLLFALHTTGLAIRWYVSGHAPWSNGYETLIYIAWATVLAGIVFSNRSGMTLSVTSVLAFLILNTAHLSWMDPQITNLMPVLKSPWLIIHVATITASYGFLALGALLSFMNLLQMAVPVRIKHTGMHSSIGKLSRIIEMALILGLYLLTTGTFLGAVWANESWGRYWGWDPKETWALATVIVYAFILHMRLISRFQGQFVFNLAALLGFGSVLMTYFGVNYYLSGMHSYAQGDGIRLPAFVYIVLGILFIIPVMAFLNQRKHGIHSMSDNKATGDGY